ncbi:hypothetical protein GPECTOR_74g708 [Gonium pectorale]|uniref:Ricin B lectin domain-containing protein n=1 Tax=Gonium pectorale TaxID=33097 RepID=A0A150G2P9_GONPE|nr:hypothetical protein GPECTOR_74g708 [Gonium pectorale]|eukprot:KXZ44094.1 hypothetical protein GPECTOR_74g708 [Gonium pectorale]
MQVRVEDPVSSSDDTAMNGMRIACCSFPVDNTTSVISTTELRTGTSSLKSCLDIANNVHAAGTYLQQLTCNTALGRWTSPAAHVYFTLTSTLTGAYTITTINDATPLCVAAKDSGSSSGTRVALATCSSGATNQAWSVTPYGSGTYTLSPTNAAGPAQVFPLDLPTKSTAQVIKTSTTDDRCLAVTLRLQHMLGLITSGYNGGISVKSMHTTGMCLDVAGASTSSARAIIIYVRIRPRM